MYYLTNLSIKNLYVLRDKIYKFFMKIKEKVFIFSIVLLFYVLILLFLQVDKINSEIKKCLRNRQGEVCIKELKLSHLSP